ncbi:MAG: hypothetical protein WBM45_10965, partial [Woeseiaceae bacterium]
TRNPFRFVPIQARKTNPVRARSWLLVHIQQLANSSPGTDVLLASVFVLQRDTITLLLEDTRSRLPDSFRE